MNLDDVSCGGNGGLWTHHSNWTLGIVQIGSDAHIHPLFWVCQKSFLIYSSLYHARSMVELVCYMPIYMFLCLDYFEKKII